MLWKGMDSFLERVIRNDFKYIKFNVFRVEDYVRIG